MSICETCKWWNSPKMFRDHGDEMWEYELGQCMSPGLRRIYPTKRVEEIPNSNPDDAYIDIDFAHLMTGPHFGCVHHEAK